MMDIRNKQKNSILDKKVELTSTWIQNSPSRRKKAHASLTIDASELDTLVKGILNMKSKIDYSKTSSILISKDDLQPIIYIIAKLLSNIHGNALSSLSLDANERLEYINKQQNLLNVVQNSNSVSTDLVQNRTAKISRRIDRMRILPKDQELAELLSEYVSDVSTEAPIHPIPPRIREQHSSFFRNQPNISDIAKTSARLSSISRSSSPHIREELLNLIDNDPEKLRRARRLGLLPEDTES